MSRRVVTLVDCRASAPAYLSRSRGWGESPESVECNYLQSFSCNFCIWCFSNLQQPQIQNHNAEMLDYVSFINDDGVTYHSHRCGAKWGTGTFFFGHRLYYSFAMKPPTSDDWLPSLMLSHPNPRHLLGILVGGSSQTLRNQFPCMPTCIYICILACPKYIHGENQASS